MSKKVEIIFPLSYKCTNKDEGWYTYQITFKAPKWAEKTLLFGIRYYIEKLLGYINGRKN